MHKAEEVGSTTERLQHEAKALEDEWGEKVYTEIAEGNTEVEVARIGKGHGCALGGFGAVVGVAGAVVTVVHLPLAGAVGWALLTLGFGSSAYGGAVAARQLMKESCGEAMIKAGNGVKNMILKTHKNIQ